MLYHAGFYNYNFRIFTQQLNDLVTHLSGCIPIIMCFLRRVQVPTEVKRRYWVPYNWSTGGCKLTDVISGNSHSVSL